MSIVSLAIIGHFDQENHLLYVRDFRKKITRLWMHTKAMPWVPPLHKNPLAMPSMSPSLLPSFLLSVEPSVAPSARIQHKFHHLFYLRLLLKS